MTARTLYDKVWEAHVVKHYDDGQTLLYIDRHLVQEVSSPQAFAGLASRGAHFRRPDAHIALADHAVPTQFRNKLLADTLAARQIARLEENTERFGLPYISMQDRRHGIVHVIGPELGFTLPGSTLVCGDSHTSTHGAFAALAFGIGSSECETVFATQTLRQTKQKQMLVTLNGELNPGVSVKDIVLALICDIGIDGGQNHAIEFSGSTIASLSMEARMTLCNMSIEAGARVAMIAPDDTTVDYLLGRPLSPKGQLWTAAVANWRELRSDPGAIFDRTVELNIAQIEPHVTWGTTPADCVAVNDRIPDPSDESDQLKREKMMRSLEYMGLKPGTALESIEIDKVFIGSCTNSRIEDLRRSARVVAGRKIASGVTAMVVPGSAAVREQAESEGLDKVFLRSGFEWRDAGCSMCVAMNDDRLLPGERCASTSNRNFEGRQGPSGRTHLMSPEMAAAAAITGHITDVRKLESFEHA